MSKRVIRNALFMAVATVIMAILLLLYIRNTSPLSMGEAAGGYADDLELRDVVAAQGACTDSNYANQFGLPGTFAPIADFELLSAAVAAAKRQGVKIRVGNVLWGEAPEGVYRGALKSAEVSQGPWRS